MDQSSPKLKLRAMIILRNSAHGKNIRPSIDLFTISYRRKNSQKLFKKLPYVTPTVYYLFPVHFFAADLKQF